MLRLLLLVAVAVAGPCCKEKLPCAAVTTPTTTTTAAPCQQDPVTTTVAPCQQDPITTTTTTQAPCVTTPPPCMQDAPTTTVKPPCSADVEAVTTTETTTTMETVTSAVKINDTCENGWVRFKESCYYIQTREPKSLELAEKHCMELKSTLFVLDSEEEFAHIIKKTPENLWTWLGLFKNSEEEKPRFHVENSLDYTELPWLVKPGSNTGGNGWNTVSKCAAHWNPSGALGKYAFWYPCNYGFYYVCERNQTITTALDQIYIY